VPSSEPFIVVLDTNILVRLVLSQSKHARALFDAWRVGRLRVAATQATLSELWRVLHYPRIKQAFHLSDADITHCWEEIRRRVFLVEGLYEVFAVEKNASDNIFLACAIEANADYLVSQDSHLRDLKYYHGIHIIGWTHLLQLCGIAIEE